MKTEHRTTAVVSSAGTPATVMPASPDEGQDDISSTTPVHPAQESSAPERIALPPGSVTREQRLSIGSDTPSDDEVYWDISQRAFWEQAGRDRQKMVRDFLNQILGEGAPLPQSWADVAEGCGDDALAGMLDAAEGESHARSPEGKGEELAKSTIGEIDEDRQLRAMASKEEVRLVCGAMLSYLGLAFGTVSQTAVTVTPDCAHSRITVRSRSARAIAGTYDVRASHDGGVTVHFRRRTRLRLHRRPEMVVTQPNPEEAGMSILEWLSYHIAYGS